MATDNQTNISVSRTRTLQQRKKLKNRALQIVNRYTLLAGGVGLIPTPFFYQVAVAGLLSKMLYDLSELYGTSLSKQKNKAIVAAVLGGAHSEWITVYLSGNMKKILPGIAAIGNTVARPVVAAGVTYAVGKLFVQHFESGAWLKEASASSASLPSIE